MDISFGDCFQIRMFITRREKRSFKFQTLVNYFSFVPPAKTHCWTSEWDCLRSLVWDLSLSRLSGKHTSIVLDENCSDADVKENCEAPSCVFVEYYLKTFHNFRSHRLLLFNYDRFKNYTTITLYPLHCLRHIQQKSVSEVACTYVVIRLPVADMFLFSLPKSVVVTRIKHASF